MNQNISYHKHVNDVTMFTMFQFLNVSPPHCLTVTVPQCGNATIPHCHNALSKILRKPN